ncbi:hypothetical protein [Agromyces sp. CCNWLW203]|uniref:hypothetical protein n=1 Tax=Agromyces sp. CCNWLW203 TaxID=3112842 RepID=UPI002F9688D7
MTDDATSGIDPRFDPRYQRGYDGSDAAVAPHPSEQRRSEPAAGSLPPTLQSGEARPPAEVGPPVIANTNPAPESSTASSSPSARASTGPGHDGPVFETDAVGEPEPEPAQESRLVRRWFAAAWAMLGVCVVAGLAVTWAVNSDPNTYTGINPNDLLRQLSWVVAPNLVRVGLVGIVGLTVWIGVRQVLAAQGTRDSIEAQSAAVPATPSDDGRVLPRGFAVTVLFALIGAGAVVVVWWASVSTDRSIYNYSAEPSDEQMNAIAVAQTAGALVGPAIEMALWAVFGIIVLGVSAAMARGRRRTAVVSSVRARSAPLDRP